MVGRGALGRRARQRAPCLRLFGVPLSAAAASRGATARGSLGRAPDHGSRRGGLRSALAAALADAPHDKRVHLVLTGAEDEVLEAQGADLVVALGPVAQREAQKRLDAAVLEIAPGLPVDVPERTLTLARCVVHGTRATFAQSGLDIVARAMGVVLRQLGAAELVVVGDEPEPEALRELVVASANGPLVVHVVDRYDEAGLLLVPSWSFGFEALAAVAAGDPVLVATQSNVGGVMLRAAPLLAPLCVVDVTQDLSRDATEWARRIVDELREPALAVARARRLRFALRETISWEATARAVCDRLAGGALAAPSTAIQADADLALLLSPHFAAVFAKDPAAIGATLHLLTDWMHRPSDGVDGTHRRWTRIASVFRNLDLSLFTRGGPGTDDLALCFARVDYHRQTELSLSDRIALLDRIRPLLTPSQFYAVAKLDLARAQLLAFEEDPAAIALSLDALACAEQMQDPWFLASAYLSRAVVLAHLARLEEAKALAEQAHALYQREGARHGMATAQRVRAEILLSQTPPDIIGASVCTAEALAGFKEAQDSGGEAIALLSRATVLIARNRKDEGLKQYDGAIELYELLHLRTMQARALLRRAHHLSTMNRDREAIRDLERAERYLRESPETTVLLEVLVVRARAHLKLGEAPWFSDSAPRMESIARALGVTRLGAHGFLSLARLARALPVPDRVLGRRTAATAIEIAKAIGDEDRLAAAQALLAAFG